MERGSFPEPSATVEQSTTPAEPMRGSVPEPSASTASELAEGERGSLPEQTSVGGRWRWFGRSAPWRR